MVSNLEGNWKHSENNACENCLILLVSALRQQEKVTSYQVANPKENTAYSCRMYIHVLCVYIYIYIRR